MSNKSKEKKVKRKKKSWIEEKQMLLVVSGQTFLWALYLVTMESGVVIGPSLGRANATCSVTHTTSLWSQTASSLTRVQTQCLALLNKGRIKSLSHLIALF